MYHGQNRGKQKNSAKNLNWTKIGRTFINFVEMGRGEYTLYNMHQWLRGMDTPEYRVSLYCRSVCVLKVHVIKIDSNISDHLTIILWMLKSVSNAQSVQICRCDHRQKWATSIVCIVLHSSIYIAPLDSHGQTEALVPLCNAEPTQRCGRQCAVVGEPVKDIPHIPRDPAKHRNAAHKTGYRSEDPI